MALFTYMRKGSLAKLCIRLQRQTLAGKKELNVGLRQTEKPAWTSTKRKRSSGCKGKNSKEM